MSYSRRYNNYSYSRRPSGLSKEGDQVIHKEISSQTIKHRTQYDNPDKLVNPNHRLTIPRLNIINKKMLCGLRYNSTTSSFDFSKNDSDITCIKCLKKLGIWVTKCKDCNRRIIADRGHTCKLYENYSQY